MPQNRDTIQAGHRADVTFRVLLLSLLFAYAGFILAVLCADVLWLGRTDPSTHEPHFFKMATDADIWIEIKAAFWMSIFSSLISSLLAMIAAIPSAYALSRYRIPFARTIDTVIDLPIVIPPLIAGISLLVFFNQTAVGKGLDNLFGVVYTWRGIIVAQFFVASAFCIRALKATFDQINPRFEMVARSLGCGPFRAFWSVTLPLAKTGLMAGWIMTWARAMGEFAPIMVFAGATPGETAVLPVTAFLNLSAGHIETAVGVTVLMVVVAGVTLVTFKRLGGQGYLW
jgi:molybdate transport system permease protein